VKWERLLLLWGLLTGCGCYCNCGKLQDWMIGLCPWEISLRSVVIEYFLCGNVGCFSLPGIWKWRIFWWVRMVYGSCVTLEALQPITSVLRRQMRWVFRKITSESTLRLLTELQRFFLSLCSSQDLLFVHTLFFSLVFVIDLCRLWRQLRNLAVEQKELIFCCIIVEVWLGC